MHGILTWSCLVSPISCRLVLLGRLTMLLHEQPCLCCPIFPQGVFEHLAEKGQQASAPVGLQIMVHGTVPTGR